MTAIRHLPRNVWLIALISLLNDAASEIIYPLLPLYLASVLLASPRVLGLIEGVAEALSSLLKLAAGVSADRSGRSKPWIVGGYGLAAMSRPLLVLASNWTLLFGARVLDRLGKGLRSAPRDALLAASVAPEDRGLAYGLHRAMDNAGAVIGPLLAYVLLAAHWGYTDIFWVASAVGLCAFALSLALREPSDIERKPVQVVWRWRDLPPPLRRFLLIFAVFQLSNSSNAFLLLRANDLGFAPEHVALLWALAALVAVIFGIPLSRLSDHVDRRLLIFAGWLLYAAIYAGFAYTGATAVVWLFAAFGLYLAATEGAEKALIADLAAQDRGTAFGWFHLISGLTLLPASLLMGVVWARFGATTSFAIAGGLSLVSALWLAHDWLRSRATT